MYGSASAFRLLSAAAHSSIQLLSVSLCAASTNMKILLNLLPEEKKTASRKNVHGRFLLWQLFLTFFLEGFFILILFGIFLVLDLEYQSIHQSNSLQNDNAMNEADAALIQYESKFRGTNEAIDVIGRFDATHLYFTQIFRLLDAVQPEGIVLRDLSTNDKVVSLAGTAATRDDIIGFTDRLKAHECVSNANVPLSNLFSESNIDFQIDFEMATQCLRRNNL